MTLEHLKQLEGEFSERFFLIGSTRLLRPADALDFLTKGIQMGLVLEGIEGFNRLASGAIQPAQELSTDILDSDGGDFVARAVQVIESKLHEDCYFEVVMTSS